MSVTSRSAYQQRRIITAGSLRAPATGESTDVRSETRVSYTTDSGTTAEVDLWNVGRDEWSNVSPGDPFRIELGYQSGISSVVFVGVVKEKSAPQREGADTRYRIRGPDQSEQRVRGTTVSHTWSGKPDIATVARDIAGFAGLSTGTITAPTDPLDTRWPIVEEHALSHWLDKLTREAADRDERAYEWQADAGKLHFLPVEQASSQAVVLSDDPRTGNIIRFDESDGKSDKTGGGANIDFKALLNPQLSRDALVQAQTENSPGTYRVESYELRSSTETGDHTMSGTLAPTSAEYRIVPERPPHAQGQ